jgi:anaerobic magnesium-protoporphyrin IX monomethyl ester cyclase
MEQQEIKPTIVFINTPTQLYYRENVSEVQDYSTIPPLGLGYVATAASEVVPKNNITFIDAENLRLPPEEIINNLININPDYVALNATTPNWYIVKDLIFSIQQAISGRIVIGGSHAILESDNILRDTDINHSIFFICVGNGEPTIIELLKGAGLSKIPNIKYIDECNNIVESQSKNEKRFVNTIIDRSFFLNDPLITGNKVESYILSARGCPYRCSFCAAPVLSPTFLKREDISLRRELADLISQGVNYIRFVDDLFLSSRTRINQLQNIWTELELGKANFSFEATARTNIAHRFSDETWKLLLDMGLKEIEIGIESGSQRILNLMSKKTSNQEVVKTVRMAIFHGIKVKGFLMLGYPTETQRDLEQTYNLAKELKAIGGRAIRFSPVIVKAYPGTAIYEKYSYLVDSLANDYLLDITQYFKDTFSEQEENILKKRTRYNAVHTSNNEPVSLSEMTGGARLLDVLRILVQIILISENQPLSEKLQNKLSHPIKQTQQ